MSNPYFVALYSTDETYVRQDQTKCLSEELDAIKASIPSAVDTSNFATANHTHEGYAASDHTHTGYAESNHSHSEYAASEHDHDDEYAASNHSHQPEAITAHMGHNYYAAPAGAEYVTLPLTTSVTVGTGLTMENNAIKVGAGISKVRISGQVCVGSSNRTNKFLAIRKNTNTQLARAQMKLSENTTAETMAIAPLVVNVAENDLLTLDFYGEKDDTIYGGINLTYITVEKLA